MRSLFIAGIGLWTPGYASPDAWLEDRHDPDSIAPACAMLNARIGRYTSLVTRMAVEVLGQAGRQSQADLRTIPTVFGSANGEIRLAFEQLDMIEAEGVPSPARFKNSVHNTASGHSSIATGHMGFTTALAAGGATFAMCLLEAWGWLEIYGRSIIVVIADESLPDHLLSVARCDPLGVAFHLSTEPPPCGSLGLMSDLRRRDHLPPAAAIADRLEQNPCAAALPLVDAALRKRAGATRVEIDGEGWSVEFQPDGMATS